MRILTLLLTLLIVGNAWAESLPESKVIPAILGEASNYPERLAIAHAIINRGHLKGVYGHLKASSDEQYQEGSKIWHEALESTVDPIYGADHWLSDYDLKHSRPKLIAWRKRMKETAYIGNTHFYKKKGAK